ncbi:hypothetical protein [Oricola sp.]|uniref:hypothetical protein n=1 Tax=Oricola sp. TaxID=1979950 RepID=UPI0035188709
MNVPKIGLRQALRLTNMKRKERLAFFAEGFPLLLHSAHGFWNAAKRLENSRREAEVLIGFANEEAAKILIIMDIVRCPPTKVDARIGTMLKWFYSHLARLLYAEAAEWNAIDLVELRRYVDLNRRTHYLDGPMSEYIFPNSPLHNRESLLYVDIEAYEDGFPHWSAPKGKEHLFPIMEPPALSAVEALSAVGAFSEAGLSIVAEVWGAAEFAVTQREQGDHPQQFAESDHLIQIMLGKLLEAALPREDATQEHVNAIYRHWQMPMYNLDFRPIKVSLEELEAEREAAFWAEVGR